MLADGKSGTLRAALDRRKPDAVISGRFARGRQGGRLKLIVATPAGRERYLKLLSHYVLASPEVAEWHLWDNCRNESDRAYLRRLAATDPRCRIKELPGADGNLAIIGDFFRYCDDPEALYLRLDDDIVFIEPGFFPRFIARAEAERGKALWFTPLIVNNAICTWLLKHRSSLRFKGKASAQAMCPSTWARAELPIALHPVFIEAVKAGRLTDFRVPDETIRLARFSINAFGFFGADKVALGEKFYAPDADDEEWLSAVLPVLTGRCGKIFGDLVIAHFSFFTQERQLLRTDILDRYYALAGLPPHKSRRALREVLRDWRRAKSSRPPRYRISLA